MQFLSGNVPIMRIARKFGMSIVAGGRDANAYLELQPAYRAETWCTLRIDHSCTRFQHASGAHETQETKLASQ
jgi:hypothetical protein